MSPSSKQDILFSVSYLAAFAIFIVFAAIMAVIWLGTRFLITGGELSQFIVYAIMVALIPQHYVKYGAICSVPPTPWDVSCNY
jgi:hypothetical protein